MEKRGRTCPQALGKTGLCGANGMEGWQKGIRVIGVGKPRRGVAAVGSLDKEDERKTLKTESFAQADSNLSRD